MAGNSHNVLVTRERLKKSRMVAFLTHSLADIISAVEFDHSGDYLATGDRGGRVVLFERNDGVGCLSQLICQKKSCEYKFYTEFQSHEPEFDYLKSLEIEEKINKIRWCKKQNAAHFLLSTNGMCFRETLSRLFAISREIFF